MLKQAHLFLGAVRVYATKLDSITTERRWSSGDASCAWIIIIIIVIIIIY